MLPFLGTGRNSRSDRSDRPDRVTTHAGPVVAARLTVETDRCIRQ